LSEEQIQADEALRELQLLIRQGRDSFGIPTYSISSAVDLGRAIELLVDRRIALREKQLLETFRQILEGADEPA
jgi:hypothetical protein